MLLKNFRNIPLHGCGDCTKRLPRFFFRIKEGKNRGAGSRHAGTGSKHLKGCFDLRVDPHSNRLQIVVPD